MFGETSELGTLAFGTVQSDSLQDLKAVEKCLGKQEAEAARRKASS